MSVDPSHVKKYYDFPVSPEFDRTGAAGAKLIWYITQDQLSPPLSNNDFYVENPHLLIEATEGRIRDLVKKLGAGPGDKILDIGCGIGGPGRLTGEETGADIIGINISQQHLLCLRALSQLKGSGYTQVITSDMRQLPLPDGVADGAFSINAMYHASNPELTLGEIHRTLKPGARFVLDDWFATNRTSPEILERLRTNWSSPYGFHNYNSVVAEAYRQGFEIVEQIDFTEEAGAFFSEDRLGAVYDNAIANRVRDGFIELWPEYREYADQSVQDLRSDMLSMGELYRNGQATYRNLVLQKAGE